MAEVKDLVNMPIAPSGYATELKQRIGGPPLIDMSFPSQGQTRPAFEGSQSQAPKKEQQ